jgi:hypothetical protein
MDECGAEKEPLPPVSVCPSCWGRYRGLRPAGFGDDPVCAFPNGARFSHENWQCAALDPLRELTGEYPGDVEREGLNVMQLWDQKVATLIIHDNIELADYEGFAVALVVTWYKRRGRTDAAWLLFDDGTAVAPTFADLAAICAGYAAIADAREHSSPRQVGDASPGRALSDPNQIRKAGRG